jgi:ceramide glucosyltransferase
MDRFSIFYLMLLSAVLVPALLLTAQTWEFRRFVLSRLKHPRKEMPTPPVLLFAPCKGLDPELPDNLRPLFSQDYPNYRLTLIVESNDDPACEPIRELISEHPQVQARLLVAGIATYSGQKVHNLLAATAYLGDAEYLAFVDSDARPKSAWLRQLVQHLDRSGASASTGYRWFVPLRNSLPNLILHSLNAAVASLVGPGKHHMVWGGAWAIRRDAFDALKMREAWNGTLSDDLVAARQLAGARRKLEFEPACMTASPIDFGWRQLAEFVRRQYTVARFYAPGWWLLALVFCSLSQVVFWGALAAMVAGITLQAPWTWLATATSGGMYGTYVLRGMLRQNAADQFAAEYRRDLFAARCFDVWLSPIAGLVNWVGLLSSLFGNRITWRSITYSIRTGGQVRVLRQPDRDESIIQAPIRQPIPAVQLRKAG